MTRLPSRTIAVGGTSPGAAPFSAAALRQPARTTSAVKFSPHAARKKAATESACSSVARVARTRLTAVRLASPRWSRAPASQGLCANARLGYLAAVHRETGQVLRARDGFKAAA